MCVGAAEFYPRSAACGVVRSHEHDIEQHDQQDGEHGIGQDLQIPRCALDRLIVIFLEDPIPLLLPDRLAKVLPEHIQIGQLVLDDLVAVLVGLAQLHSQRAVFPVEGFDLLLQKKRAHLGIGDLLGALALKQLRREKQQTRKQQYIGQDAE